MIVQVLGCRHEDSPPTVRPPLALGPSQTDAVLAQLRQTFPDVEAVLLSTCNRVELYTARVSGDAITRRQVADVLTGCHVLEPNDIPADLYEFKGRDAVKHLFVRTSCLDGAKTGDAQHASQVNLAYKTASQHKTTGPIIQAVFRAAFRVAQRIASEISLDVPRDPSQRDPSRRQEELPNAMRVIDEETDRFMGETHLHDVEPVILKLEEVWSQPKEHELQRLFHKLPDLSEASRQEIVQSFDRLTDNLFQPPLETIRLEARNGEPIELLDALTRLYRCRAA